VSEETQQLLDSETIRTTGDGLPGAGPQLLALTIAYHPRIERVGERAALPAGREPMGLSRLEPGFGPPGSPTLKPLGDPTISRKSALIQRVEGGIRITPHPQGARLEVSGRPMGAEPRLIPEKTLSRGAVLQLGDRIVLLLHEVGPEPTMPPDDVIVGHSRAILRARRAIADVADLDVPVLIRGESGTGKELAARAVHDRSGRTGPFTAVNMAALNPSVAAAELFGHVKGAFTGAVASRDGLFAAASGGTLFLDEIGDMPIEVQVALLRVLETGEVRPVGGHRARAVDVRLVAATDAKLQERVSAGTFRLALLQRISGYQIHMPPLRERRDDVGRLLARFLHEELERQGHLDRLHPQDRGAKPWLPAVIVGRLLRYRWPGNVRELRNVVRQIVITNRSTQTFELDPAVEALFLTEPSAPSAPVVAEVDAPAAQRRPADITDAQLVSTLRENDYRYESTARALGIARNSLMALIEKSPSVRRPRDIAPHEITATLAACDGDTTRAAAALGVPRRGLQRRITELGL